MTTSSILQQLRSMDREAYLATLYLPESKRDAVAALWAFDSEIDRVRDLISEPLPGEIRLQWWRDVIAGNRAEEGRQHPVGAALLDAIDKNHLPVQPFDNLCEARIFDLYDDAMPTRSDLEGYFGETRSVLLQLIAQILGDEAPTIGDAAGHAGIALGSAQLLCRLALHRSRRQLFIPSDILSSTGMSAEKFFSMTDASRATPLVEALVAMGREHLSMAMSAINELPIAQRRSFIRLGTCQPIFNAAEKRGGAVALEPLTISPIKIQWHLFRTSAKFS